MTGGERLREVREKLGLSLRTVEAASERLAKKRHNGKYFIAMSRLSEIETKGIIPNPHRIYSLAVIYRLDISTIMEFYEICVESIPADLDVVDIPQTHKVTVLDTTSSSHIPVRLDPSFRLSDSAPMGRMIMKWGTVPLAYLKGMKDDQAYSYGFVGTEDWTMYPLIMPGSFIQIDENKRKISKGLLASEYQRPIYFVDTRQGYICSWCQLAESGRLLTLVPHPMSNVDTRIVQLGSEAEIIGQVVGIAMRLDGWTEPTSG